MTENKFAHLGKDALLLAFSLIIAFLLVKSNELTNLLTSAQPENAYLGALFAGIFFTSFFTTAPAIVLLGKISIYSQNPLLVAIFGATGALIGDEIIFRFIHNRLRGEVMSMSSKKWSMRLKHIFHKKIYHRFAPLVAALIIASPLPDELGLALVGLDDRKQGSFELFSFLANFIGVIAIAFAARVV